MLFSGIREKGYLYLSSIVQHHPKGRNANYRASTVSSVENFFSKVPKAFDLL